MGAQQDGFLWDAPRLSAPHEQRDKAARVRGMFDAIAPYYERINKVASAGRDRYWRREMVRLSAVEPDDVLLDIACGTGDVARAFASSPVRPGRIVGLDFSFQMLAHAITRPIRSGDFCQGDGLRLPIADESVSVTSCAFGVRNFQNLEVGLQEMHRVLRAGGRAVVLEFSLPAQPILRRLYLFYFTRLMPAAATLISRDRTGAYRYLPRSVLSFHESDAIVSCFKNAGFGQVTVFPLTWGVVSVYRAVKGGLHHSIGA